MLRQKQHLAMGVRQLVIRNQANMRASALFNSWDASISAIVARAWMSYENTVDRRPAD